MSLPLTVSEACFRGYLQGAAGGQRPFFLPIHPFCTFGDNFYLCISLASYVLTQPRNFSRSVRELLFCLRGFRFSLSGRFLFLLKKLRKMFDKFQSIFAGFTGVLKGFPERKLVWLALITSLFEVMGVIYMIFLAQPAYESLLKYVPFAGNISFMMSTGVALMVWFGTQYATGFLVERIRRVPAAYADFNIVGAMLAILVTAVFGYVDYSMQLRGGEVHVENHVGAQVEYKYDGSGIDAKIADVQNQLDALLAGKTAGKGWWHGKGAERKYLLNNSGTALQDELIARKQRLLDMDVEQRNLAAATVKRTNSDKDTTEAQLKETSSSSSWLVIAFLALAGLMGSFAVESIQARIRGHALDEGSFFGGAEFGAKDPAEAFATAQRNATDKRSIGYDRGGPKDHAMQKPGNLGNCKHCGHEFTKRTVWHEFCTPACRTANWEVNNPGKKATHARNASDAKA